MTEQETSRIVTMLLSTLRLTRPIPDPEAMLAGWSLALDDVPYEAAERAAAWWMANETLVPEPASLRRRALGEMAQLPEPYAAWSFVLDELEFRRQHGYWREEPNARRYHAMHGCWPEYTESTIDQAVNALGGWEGLTGDHWERREFLKAYEEFSRATINAAAVQHQPLDGPALRAVR